MRQGQQPEYSLDWILANIAAKIGRISQLLGARGSSAIALLAVVVVGGIWLVSGVYSVEPSEQAALRLFGKYDTTVEPGLHWYWPWPVGKRVLFPVRETRRMELGFISKGETTIDVPSESLMITGDLNIVDIKLVVQYRVNDLKKFMFAVDDPGDPERSIPPGRPEATTLKEATEAVLRQVVGQRAIEELITVGREEVQSETRLLLQGLMDSYETGLQILEVRLQSVLPPDEVRDAFDDVVRARVDQESIINQANSYKEEQLPKALGREAQIVQAAEAFKAERIARAEGESQRFLSVLEEYQNSREVTRQRLYLEAMEEILPGITKIVIDPEAGGGLLQLLNIGEIPLAKTPFQSDQSVAPENQEESGQ